MGHDQRRPPLAAATAWQAASKEGCAPLEEHCWLLLAVLAACRTCISWCVSIVATQQLCHEREPCLHPVMPASPCAVHAAPKRARQRRAAHGPRNRGRLLRAAGPLPGSGCQRLLGVWELGAGESGELGAAAAALGLYLAGGRCFLNCPNQLRSCAAINDHQCRACLEPHVFHAAQAPRPGIPTGLSPAAVHRVSVDWQADLAGDSGICVHGHQCHSRVSGELRHQAVLPCWLAVLSSLSRVRAGLQCYSVCHVCVLACRARCPPTPAWCRALGSCCHVYRRPATTDIPPCAEPHRFLPTRCLTTWSSRSCCPTGQA